MDFAQILYDVDGPVATITMNRPERLNAFTITMQQEMVAALDLADADDGVRAVIVTGAGKGFCAGADLAGGGETFDADAVAEATGGASPTPEGNPYPRDFGGLLTLRIFQMIKPVIAAINGAAVGIGATMTLPMDVRLAADDAKLGFVFAGRGIVPEAASSWFLPRVVGISQALEWTMTARVFPAEEGLRGGLIRSLHPKDDLLPAARALAEEIATNAAPVSVALTRQMLWRMLGADHPMVAHRLDSRGVYSTGRSIDAREGVMAFLEKRPATWTMRPSTDMPEWYPWWHEPEYE
ncbi:crotonase/enoyl-CoA hydratase family protein [Rhabdothermincola sp.]|uniref:crotonase/enoyl-CoA hydratase family protein n=1 Tax=Rhabdothermincola sp. TaxID=2820405 RepID=UPI002FE1B709